MSTALEITPDMIKQAGYALAGTVGTLLTAVGFLIRTAHKMGKDAEKVRASMDLLTEIKTAVAKIPLIESQIGQVEEAWREARSDIKHLLRGSRPDHGEASNGQAEE